MGGGSCAGHHKPAERAVTAIPVTPRAGDEHGRAVGAIHEESLERPRCLRTVTAQRKLDSLEVLADRWRNKSPLTLG